MTLQTAVFLAAGAALYILVMWDVLKTTLSMHGGGPITNGITRAIDRYIANSGKRAPQESARQSARYSNLLFTVLLFVTWFTGLLAASLLLSGAQPSSVTQVADSEQGYQWFSRLYFVAASLTTAGFGDYVPVDVYGQALTVVTATSGLVVTSLGISYVVSLVSAVAAQRALARRITNLGRSPVDILAAFWDGERFEGFGAVCESISAELLTHTQRHLAYPAVHYVRADDDRDSVPAAVALLDETLTVLLYETPVEALPPRASLIVMRRAIGTYLESLAASFVREVPEAPPWPDASFLYERFGLLPVGRTRAFTSGDHRAIDRRRGLLRAGVTSQGIEFARLWEYLHTPEEDRLDGDVVTALVHHEGARDVVR